MTLTREEKDKLAAGWIADLKEFVKVNPARDAELETIKVAHKLQEIGYRIVRFNGPRRVNGRLLQEIELAYPVAPAPVIYDEFRASLKTE